MTTTMRTMRARLPWASRFNRTSVHLAPLWGQMAEIENKWKVGENDVGDSQ